MAAGQIKKGGFIVIKNRPCRVVDVSTSKTGKHGHAKCNFTALDIFNGKKCEDMCPSSHNCDVPNITRCEYLLVDIQEDGFVSLMNEETGDLRDDMQMPTGTDDATKLAGEIKAAFDDSKEVRVTTVRAMGEEQIQSFKMAEGA